MFIIYIFCVRHAGFARRVSVSARPLNTPYNNNNICLKSNIQTSSVDYAPRELTHACSRSETCSRSDTEACDMCYVF